jgi:uncharacterized protein (DUF2461 family)
MCRRNGLTFKKAGVILVGFARSILTPKGQEVVCLCCGNIKTRLLGIIAIIDPTTFTCPSLTEVEVRFLERRAGSGQYDGLLWSQKAT